MIGQYGQVVRWTGLVIGQGSRTLADLPIGTPTQANLGFSLVGVCSSVESGRYMVKHSIADAEDSTLYVNGLNLLLK